MVTRQLQVERRTGKVRRPKTDVLPLCHQPAYLLVLQCMRTLLFDVCCWSYAVQDDDSQDWAEMRSWLVWCLRDKLGDADVLSDGAAGPRRQSPVSSSRAGSITSRGPRQLVRQQAVHERSPRIGVVDCSGPTPTGCSPVGRHLLRCRSAETRGERLSLDGSAGDSAGSVAGRLTVGASCSGQSSFESYGSAG